jgi:hypothetical protein
VATKTTPNTIADAIKQAETEHGKKARTYAADALSMREKVEKFQTEKEQAEERLNGIRAAFTRADDSVSALDYATAHFATDRAGQLLDGARKTLKRLESKPIHSDKHVAERIAEAVRAIVPSDVEVIPTFADVRTFETDHAAIVVVQNSPTVFTGGRESAGVTVRAFRNQRYSQMFDRPKLASAITARGWHIPGAHVPGDKMNESHGVGVDEIEVQAVSVFSAMPILKQEPTEYAARMAASVIPFDAAERLNLGPVQPVTGGVRSGQYVITVEDIEVDSKTVRGERETTVTATLAFQTNTLSVPSGSLRQAIVEAAQNFPGRFVGGVGIVEGAAIKHLSNPEMPGTAGTRQSIAVRFSAKSKTGA